MRGYNPGHQLVIVTDAEGGNRTHTPEGTRV